MSPPNENPLSAPEHGRLREAFQSLSEAPQPELCPSPEQLWDAVAGVLDTEATHALIEHTAACAGCAEEWRLAREMQGSPAREAPTGEAPAAEAPGEGRGRVIAAAHRFRRAAAPIIGLAVAAMLLLVVGLPKKEAPPAEYRAGQAEEIQSLIPRGEALPRELFVLRWSELDGAVYSLVVSGADLRVIDQPSELTEAIYQVPAAALEGVDGEVYWQVEAALADGSTLSSKTFVQAIAPGN